MSASRLTVAIIGGGIAGICGARACLEEGLVPMIFEKASRIGGHWSLEKGSSGVFDSLTTNTTFFENTFPDLLPLRKGKNDAHGPHASHYMSGVELYNYLIFVVDSTPGLRQAFHLGCEVTSVVMVEDGLRYKLTWEEKDKTYSKVFDRVVVATGRMQTPYLSPVVGIDQFPGRVLHSKDYRNPSEFEGQNVLVVGGHISGTECAGDLGETPVGAGPRRVTLSTLQAKNHFAKQSGDLDFSMIYFRNRLGLSLQSGACVMPTEFVNLHHASTKLSTNAEYGLPGLPPTSPFVPVHTKFLEAHRCGAKLKYKVASVKRVDETGTVSFSDGTSEVFDSIIFATGYYVDLPFFSEGMQKQILSQDTDMRNRWLDLYCHTWHHSLPGLAFIGTFAMIGTVLPVFDAQARWVARCFADKSQMPSKNEIQNGISEWLEKRQGKFFIEIEIATEVAHLFAAKGGFGINYKKYPHLAASLLIGPFVPQMFRMFGYGALENGLELYEEGLKLAGGVIDESHVTEEDIRELRKALEAFLLVDQVPEGLAQAIAQVERKRKQT